MFLVWIIRIFSLFTLGSLFKKLYLHLLLTFQLISLYFYLGTPVFIRFIYLSLSSSSVFNIHSLFSFLFFFLQKGCASPARPAYQDSFNSWTSAMTHVGALRPFSVPILSKVASHSRRIAIFLCVVIFMSKLFSGAPNRLLLQSRWWNKSHTLP